MSTLEPRPGWQVANVSFTEDDFSVELDDGRTVIVPLTWFPRLLYATPAERENWQLAGAGFGIHWPDVDEDISVEQLLSGVPAGRTGAAYVRQLQARRERAPA